MRSEHMLTSGCQGVGAREVVADSLPLEQLPVTKATGQIIDGLKYLQNLEALSDSELDRAEVLAEDLMTDVAQLGDRIRALKARRAGS